MTQIFGYSPVSAMFLYNDFVQAKLALENNSNVIFDYKGIKIEFGKHSSYYDFLIQLFRNCDNDISGSASAFSSHLLKEEFEKLFPGCSDKDISEASWQTVKDLTSVAFIAGYLFCKEKGTIGNDVVDFPLFPSTDEIIENSNMRYNCSSEDEKMISERKKSFIEGAEWMKYKIKNQ